MIDTSRDGSKDTHSIAIFRDDPVTLINQLKATRRPITITVDGKPAAILQDPAEYQRLLDVAALADANEGIRQGLEQLERGEGRPASQFFAELRERYGLPR